MRDCVALRAPSSLHKLATADAAPGAGSNHLRRATKNKKCLQQKTEIACRGWWWGKPNHLRQATIRETVAKTPPPPPPTATTTYGRRFLYVLLLRFAFEIPAGRKYGIYAHGKKSAPNRMPPMSSCRSKRGNIFKSWPWARPGHPRAQVVVGGSRSTMIFSRKTHF